MLNKLFKKKQNLTPKDVEVYYEKWTEQYIKGFGEFFQAKQAIDIPTLTSYYIAQMGIMPGMKLVDAGCGIGGPALQFAKQLEIQIDAITISEKQVQEGEIRIKQENMSKRVHINKLDFHTMADTLQNNSYDIVYFLESLVHSNQPDLAIKQAYMLLKPDGVIYIKDLYEKTAYSADELPKIQYWVNHNNEKIKLNIIKKEEVLIMLRNQGFQLEFCQLMRIPTNQDLGNKFVVDYNIMPDPIANSLPPYLEWYEIKAIKPGPGLVNKM